MTDVSIRTTRPEDDERLMEIRNSNAPDRAPMTAVEHRHFVRTMPERAQFAAVVAERGEIVGYASWARRVFTQEEDSFWLDILVDRTYWGTGIGRALYDHAAGVLAELGARKVVAYVREDLPDAEAWAARRGFKRTGHGDRISRLDVQSANLEKAREAMQRVEASGIRITTLAETGMDDSMLQALMRLDEETSRDVPGQEDYVGLPEEEFRSLFLEVPGMSPETFWVALDGGRPVGMSPLQRRSAGFADNAYTGVDRVYRGRGIAQALKLRAIEWAQQNGIHSIMTGNDPANKPMLAVNIALGYQFLPANIQLAKNL
jgi:GNAT superfamily N-acetyltransferase